MRQRLCWAGMFAACAALAGAVPRAGAADYEQRQAGGKAVLRFSADQVTGDVVQMALSYRGTLTISVEGPAPVSVENEQAVVEAQTVAVGEIWNFKRSVKKTDLPGGRQRWELSFDIDPKAQSGKKYPIDNAFLPVPISFRDGSGSVQTASWKGVTVRVTTSVENPDKPSAGQLHDITGIEESPGLANRKMLIVWLGAAGSTLLVAALVLCLWQFARKRVVAAAALPPEAWALRELDRVEAQRLPEVGQGERYHTLLSDVVRHYLERRFRLRAPQQTTAEFLVTMQSWPLLPAPQQAGLREFLERCDLAKFAGVNPSPEECRAVGEMARNLVRQAEAARAAPVAAQEMPVSNS